MTLWLLERGQKADWPSFFRLREALIGEGSSLGLDWTTAFVASGSPLCSDLFSVLDFVLIMVGQGLQILSSIQQMFGDRQTK